MWILEESCYEVSSCCFLKQLTINTKRYMILLPYLYHISILCCILCISNNNWKNILCISWKVEGKWSYKLSSWLGLGKEPGQPGARPGTASFKMSLGSIELGHDQLSMTHSAQPIKRANLVLKIKFILCMFNNRVTYLVYDPSGQMENTGAHSANIPSAKERWACASGTPWQGPPCACLLVPTTS